MRGEALMAAVHRALLPLQDATDPSLCGHKAAALAELLRYGERVPDGFVITATACASSDGEMLRRQIHSALEAIPGPVAVRSSAIAEDLDDASFAGQYETFLDVSGSVAVVEAVRRCIASASATRVSAYAGVRGAGTSAGQIAVLVQKMVRAEVAGVAFSADPRTGDDCTVVSAARGVGLRLVSGETAADEWIVKDGKAERVASFENCVDGSTVLRIAELARRVSRTRGMPQDIEWAIAGGDLHLLQARPITALPVRPDIELPSEGTWTKDLVHYPDLLTPFGADVYLPALDHASARVASQFGLMIEGLRSISLGGEVYTRVMPPSGKEGPPPPWWVLAIASRIVPSLRSRCRAAEKTVASGDLEALPARWESDWRPALEAEIRGHQQIELSDLDDAALLSELNALIHLLRRGQVIHFQLSIPFVIGIAELVQGCREMLGWGTGETLKLLSGFSPTSSGPARALDELASLAASSSDGVDALREGDFERLQTSAPAFWTALSRYRDTWGWRPLNYDPGSLALAERPDLLARQILERLETGGSGRGVDALRKDRIDEARSQLRDGLNRRRFDSLLGTAERIYPLREDNVRLTDNLPAGLIRRLLLEAGRRLCERGHLRHAHDAAWLRESELREAVSGRPAPDLARGPARRRAEHAWVRAHPGPTVLGPAPADPPNLRGLPEAVRRINQAVIWAMEQELGSTSTPTGGAVSGLGVCGGRHEGTVRVIRGELDFARLRRGDVLVCAITTPAWSPLFAVAGAVVTDTGSLLSHAAIVAREHGLPTVIATGNATRKLRDGDVVIVDGAAGSVLVQSRARPIQDDQNASKTVRFENG
jgi:pyruvate,water dikinase